MNLKKLKKNNKNTIFEEVKKNKKIAFNTTN